MIKDAPVNRKLPVLNFVKNHSVLKCPLLYFAEITSLPNTMFIFKASLEISRAWNCIVCIDPVKIAPVEACLNLNLFQSYHPTLRGENYCGNEENVLEITHF